MSDGSFEYGIFSNNVNNRGRSSDINETISQLEATYITSTDTPNTDHSGEENILLGNNKYGLVDIPVDDELTNYHIKEVHLYLPVIAGSTNSVIYAYYLKDIDINSNVTYSDIASHIECIDYAKVTEYRNVGKFISLDITAALRSENRTVILSSESNITLGKSITIDDENDSLFTQVGAPKVIFSFNYVVTAGIDNEFEYSSFDLGNAGEVYINKQSGNLVIKREDITTGNGNHPYTVTSTFNSMSTLGQGKWMHNFDANLSMLGMLYMDENATVTYLNFLNVNDEGLIKLENNSYGFETLKLEALTSRNLVVFEGTLFEKTIQIPTSIKYIITADKIKYIYTTEYGLTSIEVKDENENYRTIMAKIPDDETDNAYYLIDEDGNTVHVVNSNNAITMTQVLNGDVIGNSETIRKNENGNVVEVEKNGEIISQFTYDDQNRITTVTNDKQYSLRFEYGNDYRVISVQEYQCNVPGRKISYERAFDTCNERAEGMNGVFGDGDDVITKYSFDGNCRLICTQQKTADGEELDSVSYHYENSKFKSLASSGRISDNYLKNHNVESLNNWTSTYIDDDRSIYNSIYTTTEKYIGNGSAQVTVNDMTRTGGAGLYQEINLREVTSIEANQEYVVSGYIKTDGITRDNNTSTTRNYGASLMCEMIFNDDTTDTRYYTEVVKNTEGSWERVFTWVAIPENCIKLRVYLLVRNGTGVAYFDGIQLEKGRVPSDYNYLENNGFEYVNDSSWTRKNLNSDDKIQNGKYIINGEILTNKYIHQDIQLNENEINNKYVLRAVVKASSAPLDKAVFRIGIRTFYEDGSYTDTVRTTSFNEYNHDYQYVQTSYIIPKEDLRPTKLRVYFMYYKNINAAKVDTINLVVSDDVYEDNTIEVYDDYGNVISRVDENGDVTTYTYNSNYVKLSENTQNVDGDEIYSATYNELGDILRENDNGNITEYTYVNGQLSKVVLTDADSNITTTNYINAVITSVETKDINGDVTYSATYDEYGYMVSEVQGEEVKSFTYQRDEFNNLIVDSDGTEYVYNYYDDDNDGVNDRYEFEYSYLTVDEITSYYDNENRIIRKEDSSGIISTYLYDDIGNLVSKTENGKTITYNYNDEQLGSINRNGFSYTYDYDVWGNKDSVKIGNQTIESYLYKPNNGVLSQKTYGNGSVEKYGYNAYGNISSITAVGLGSYTFNYDSKGTLIYTRDNIGNLRKYYKYDNEGRNIGEHVVSTLNSNAYENDLYNTVIAYTLDGKVSQQMVASQDNSVKTRYSYVYTENDNDRIISQFTSSRSVTSDYDDESKIVSRTISTTTPYIQNYIYDEDGNLIEEISGNDTFTYTYDEDGRIIKIQKNSLDYYNYEYDTEGQLVREENIDKNKIIEYNYDGYGNIESKVESCIPYSNNSSIVSYSYDNVWKDKLTNYNGENISYDAIGNPTTYRGANCSYFGRQLLSYNKNNTKITYKYDGNGLRTSKTVNGVKHDYYYVDDVLVYEKVDGDYELFYRYDVDGKLSMISYYRYAQNDSGQFNVVTNSQGDVVKILGGSGLLRAEYTYDAFGNITSVYDDPYNGFSIANVNSIRYRGYVYDSETGLYYLQSRYYDPETGRFINCDDPEYIGANDTFAGWNGFAYCENDPVNDSDPGGRISLNDIGSALKKIFEAVKSKIKKFIDNYIGYYENKYLHISKSIISNIIDTMIYASSNAAISAIKKVSFKALCSNIKSFAKNNVKSVGKFFEEKLFGKILDKIIPDVYDFTVRQIAKIWAKKVTLFFTKNVIIDRLTTNFTVYNFISNFTSTGSIIAFIFDIIDGKTNGFVSIKVV